MFNVTLRKLQSYIQLWANES